MNRYTGRKISACIVSFAFALFLHAVSSLAQQQGPRLDLKTAAEKEITVKKDGEWVAERVPVGEASQGDILVFTITYLNKGEAGAVNAEIINPVPQGVVFIPESAGGQDTEITFSIDNGNSWHRPPVMITVKNPDGSEESRPAPANMYTHVKWTVNKPVLPGHSGRVSFKVTIK